MDIQEMIDSRIEALRAQQPDAITSRTPPVPPEELEAANFGRSFDSFGGEAGDGKPVAVHRQPAAAYWNQVAPSQTRMSASQPTVMDLSRFGEEIDIAMTQIANQVLEITERLAADYARFEKEMLESRLAVLKTAESVLDVALSLRQESRKMMLAASRHSQPARQFTLPVESGRREEEIADPLTEIDAAEHAMINERASMHDRGVAALFRRTL